VVVEIEKEKKELLRDQTLPMGGLDPDRSSPISVCAGAERAKV
jgi:hypothetical protein